MGSNSSNMLRIGRRPMVREARSSGMARSVAEGQTNAAEITNPACARSRADRRAAGWMHDDQDQEAMWDRQKKTNSKVGFFSYFKDWTDRTRRT